MRASISFAFALLAACSPGAESGDATDYDAQQIASNALNVFVDSWNKGASRNAQGPQLYGTLYWSDAELVDPTGSIWDGQTAIVQMHVDLWNTAFKGSEVNGTVRRTRRLSPTLMIADFNFDLKVAGPLPPTIPSTNGIVKAHLKNVMERRGDEWKAIASQNTFYSDAQPTR